MLNCYKNIDRLFYCLLFSTLIFSGHALSTLAEDISDESNPYKILLRGRVWYGMASWYGPRFHGKKTSNGEKFNRYDLTAAHRTLLFNTKVLVTNLKNNKSVVVRINDRGPFINDRIIDLSEEAASMIDAKKQGIAYIKLQVLTSALN